MSEPESVNNPENVDKMCESADIFEMAKIWQQGGYYCKVKTGEYGVEDAYFSFIKNNNTHIHVFWGEYSSSYRYQLKCNGEHQGDHEMYPCKDIHKYLDTFYELLNDCPAQIGRRGGSRKKIRRKRHYSKKNRKTRHNRA